MNKRSGLKSAFLAASALAVVGVSHAQAAPEPATRIEIAAPVDHAADEAAPAKGDLVRNIGLAAAATAAIAAFFRLLGAGRISAFVKSAAPNVAAATAAAARAPVAAVKAVGRAASTPFRFVLLWGGIGVFALTGISVLDVEWGAGLAVGAVISLLAMTGAGGLRRRLVPARRRKRP